jgi:ribosomal protein S6
VLFLADLPAQALAGLEREFRLSEGILRFLIVRVEQ